jgi:hypothetical protein
MASISPEPLLGTATDKNPAKSNAFRKQVSPAFSTIYPTEKFEPL